jgi:hypothetical protein
MRRWLSSFAAVALLAALSLPASGQNIVGPGGVFINAPASITITNSTTPTALFSQQIPASLTQPGAAPVHLRLMGQISTTAGVGQQGTVNASCNFGGSTASAAFFNAAAVPNNMSNVAWLLDVRVSPLNPGDASRTEYFDVRWSSVTATNGGVDSGTSVVGSTSLGLSQTLSCNWQWASANTGNSITVFSGVANIGD